MNTFSDFGLLNSLLESLKDRKIFKPTEIQIQAIPLLMSGQSVVGVSETGSGKTLTYSLPMLHILKSLENDGQAVVNLKSPRAIIITPTRDLGEQVSKVLKTLTHKTRLRVRPALGGMSMEHSIRNVSGLFEILIATPGRLVQLMEQELIDLTDVKMLIFDEADQMIDKGFLPDSKTIYAACPKGTQLALFSATVSPAVQDMMNTMFANAEVVRSSGSGKVVKTLVTQNRIVLDGKRWPIFEKILDQPVDGGTLVFTNTREQCDKLAKELTDKGYLCTIYRGEMDKSERRTSLRKFRDGKVDLMISTDLAARGLDLEHVGRVINYHLPKIMENYLHRVGRTARAGRAGLVINLVTERDQPLIAKLEGKKLEPRSVLNAKHRGHANAKSTDKQPIAKEYLKTTANSPKSKTAMSSSVGSSAASKINVKTKPEFLKSKAVAAKVAAKLAKEESQKKEKKAFARSAVKSQAKFNPANRKGPKPKGIFMNPRKKR